MAATPGTTGSQNGRGYTVYSGAVRIDGTLAWRNNNPGNIRPGAFATNNGAIGRGWGFAVFPDEGTGMAAIAALLQTSEYQSRTIKGAIFLYAPPADHNNTAAYVNLIQAQTGLDPERQMSSLNAAELQAVCRAIRQVEGWTPGTIFGCDTPSSPAWLLGLLGCASAPQPPAPPTVLGLIPPNGPGKGGTSVTIGGSGLTDAFAVSFGSTPAVDFSVDSDSQITATCPPANVSGSVDVTVTNANGTSATGPNSQFTFNDAGPPVVAGIDPTRGPAAGGTSVTITGVGFLNATAVTFGSTSATDFSVVNDSQITATSPPANVSGNVDVSVTTASGTSDTSSTDVFAYLTADVPSVTSVSPNSGPATGGVNVTISGANFVDVLDAVFGSLSADGFSVDSDSQITAKSPAANFSGAVDVTVMTFTGTSATVTADTFTFTS